ncbi:3-oxoacyl-ACP synthase III family protein [Streptomyces sp. H27-D2]|uniref:3-oxoacyl-ACP synthase III family protein n=1 Tax=Streptomyces sp. H27-D2 TaxID=3046304 RepID=UPI002DB95BE7|nr:ketoacyl-ACP synthase III [Streptomyces sp. H27-D2]MEC4019145.1 ketoacyl-ACP synthase III [Streptomyces sp. H27-D2]
MTNGHSGIWGDAGIRFTGFGHYFPRETIQNESFQDATTSVVEDRVIGGIGVRTRHRAADDETPTFMASEAARQALADSGTDPAEIDLVIVSHWTDRNYRDEVGALTAAAIGANNAMAFEVAGSCAGFIQAVHTAGAFLTSPGKYRKVLVAASERVTRRVRPGSKGAMLVSDGAGAVVLEASPGGEPGLIDSVFHTDGSLADMSAAYPPHGWVKSHPDLNDVALDHIRRAVQELLERNKLSIDDIDYLVPHSGTEPLAKGIQHSLGADPARVLTNLSFRGNVSSASIPSTVSELKQRGVLKPGQLLLSPSIGGGVWCWGGLLYRI